MLPALFNALAKGNDPDRMKGALYVLWNKGTGTDNYMYSCRLLTRLSAAYALGGKETGKNYDFALICC
jgi:hypothetical protein